MAKIDILNLSGAVVGSMDLSDAIFGIEPNAAAMRTVVLNILAQYKYSPYYQESGKSTKDRSADFIHSSYRNCIVIFMRFFETPQ